MRLETLSFSVLSQHIYRLGANPGGASGHGLLPGRIGFDLIGAFIAVAFRVLENIDVERFPLVQVADEQVMIPAVDFTERNQVIGIKL